MAFTRNYIKHKNLEEGVQFKLLPFFHFSLIVFRQKQKARSERWGMQSAGQYNALQYNAAQHSAVNQYSLSTIYVWTLYDTMCPLYMCGQYWSTLALSCQTLAARLGECWQGRNSWDKYRFKLWICPKPSCISNKYDKIGHKFEIIDSKCDWIFPNVTQIVWHTLALYLFHVKFPYWYIFVRGEGSQMLTAIH